MLLLRLKEPALSLRATARANSQPRPENCSSYASPGARFGSRFIRALPCFRLTNDKRPPRVGGGFRADCPAPPCLRWTATRKFRSPSHVWFRKATGEFRPDRLASSLSSSPFLLEHG